MASSLDILKSLSSNADNPTNPIQVELAQRARLDEMKRALGMTYDTTGGMDKWGNATGSSFATGATPSDVSSLESDVSKAPYTGDAAQKALVDETTASRPGTQQMAASDFAKKLGLQMAPVQAKAAGDLAVAKQQGQNKLDEQNQNPLLKLLAPSGSSGSPDATPTGPVHVSQGGISADFGSAKLPQLVQAQQHDAQMGLNQIPKTRLELDQLEKTGVVGGFRGMLTGAATKWGMNPVTDAIGITPPNSARGISAFQGQKELTLTNLARVHGGSRAAASPAIMQNWRTLVNNATTPDALRGVLDTAENWLRMYAGAKTSEEQDAIDSALLASGGGAPPASSGGTSGAATGTDLGPNWHLSGGQ